MNTDAAIAFLKEAAVYFEGRETGGEDKAHWSNVYNAENCRHAAQLIASQRLEILRLHGLLNKLQLKGGPTRKERRATKRPQGAAQP